jgi:hypothetical protein
MPPTSSRLAAGLLLAAIATLSGQSVPPSQTALERLRAGFMTPPDEARIMMRWWWFGPAVTEEGLARDLRAMADGGIGGVEVQPVYPLVLDGVEEPRQNLSFLSPAFLQRLAFAERTAHDLGLRLDLTLGTGWPYGGPQVSAEDAAGRLRWERLPVAPGTRRVPLPHLSTGEALLAAFLGGGSGDAVDPRGMQAVALDTVREGALWLEAPAASPQEVWIFISSRTGMMVKRPALGGEGFVVDHYDRGALDRYLASVGQPMIDALRQRPPFAVFCDSLEVFGSDWTPTLLDEFRRRRGYDLLPHLPALAAGTDAHTAAIRHDWGQTLTELVEDNFLRPLSDWAHAWGTRLRVQGYGMPPARLSSTASAALPEGEGAQWRLATATRWASSSSHLFDKPVTSSETWTWLHSPAFAATPLDMKAEADLHFLQGVTQLVGHGWPYTPAGVEAPGARFYAAGVFSDQNPWYHAMPWISRYFQRVSHLLRQGRPVNDVALYLPVHDAWSRFTPGRVHLFELLRDHVGPELIGSLADAGFSVDLVDDQALTTVAAVEGGRLHIGQGRYRAVILPGVETLPPDTLAVLDRFVQAGGVLLATHRAPDRAPGLLAAPADHQQVASHAARWFRGSRQAHLVADPVDAGARLATLLDPDVRWARPLSTLGVVHRQVDDTDVYFFVNTSNVAVEAEVSLRSPGRRGEWWDPLDAAIAVARTTPDGSRTRVNLSLEPYGSRFLVLAPGEAARAPAPGLPADTGDALPLADGWTVTYPGGAPVALERWDGWLAGEATRYASGVARYEREFTLPAEWVGRPGRIVIDLGEGRALPVEPLRNGMRAWFESPVREAAVVSIDGAAVGAVWAPPYQVDITTLRDRGPHRLRIEVGNSALNVMAGRPLPDDRLLHLRYGQRFDPQDMDKVRPQPSGLLTAPVLRRLPARAPTAGP